MNLAIITGNFMLHVKTKTCKADCEMQDSCKLIKEVLSVFSEFLSKEKRLFVFSTSQTVLKCIPFLCACYKTVIFEEDS